MKWIKTIVIIAIFLISMILIVEGQKNIGIPGLLIMIVGLAGILGLLYMYNRKYR